MKWNKASSSIKESKGILTDCSHEVSNKIHGAKSYPRKCMQIIHSVPTTGTLNHGKSSRTHKNDKYLYLCINEGTST